MEHNFNKGCIQILPLEKSASVLVEWLNGIRRDDPDGWIPAPEAGTRRTEGC